MLIETKKPFHHVVNQKLIRANEESIQRESASTADKKQQSDIIVLLKEKENHINMLKQRLHLSRGQIDEERKKQKVLITCLEISRRIIAGDKVPQADHQYLRKHDPDLYARSISMRFPKNNPHEYKQLSEEDDENQDDLQLDIVNSTESHVGRIKGESSAKEGSMAVLDVIV